MIEVERAMLDTAAVVCGVVSAYVLVVSVLGVEIGGDN